MELKMGLKEVQEYSPVAVEDGFIEAGFEAAIILLAEEVDGWHTYDTMNIDNVHGEELTIYTLSLDDEEYNTVAIAYVTIRGGDEQDVEIIIHQ